MRRALALRLAQLDREIRRGDAMDHHRDLRRREAIERDLELIQPIEVQPIARDLRRTDLEILHRRIDAADRTAQPALVVDLLRSVPGTPDEIMGTIISKYARCPEPEIQDAALATLVHVWGERAIGALLAGMQSSNEKVRLTALRGFKTIGGVDELAVRRIEAMLSGAEPVSDDLRAAAAEALGYAAREARPLAARAALRALTEGSVGANNAVAMAFARAALVLAPDDARKAIVARAARVPDPLRGALLALL